eukprot:2240622-Pyramimonas_sp.AAC.1
MLASALARPPAALPAPGFGGRTAQCRPHPLRLRRARRACSRARAPPWQRAVRARQAAVLRRGGGP